MLRKLQKKEFFYTPNEPLEPIPKHNSWVEFNYHKNVSRLPYEENAANQRKYHQNYQNELQRFIEISQYFSNPTKKTASYLCESFLVSYPRKYSIEYKRGGLTSGHINFSNLTLEPVYIRFYKIIPDLSQIKFTNLAFSRCKRIPPGLGFDLGIIYDDVNEKPSQDAKMIFVASRKPSTPCYQICEIDLNITQKYIMVVV